MVSSLRSLIYGKKSILNSKPLKNSDEHNLTPSNVTAKIARKFFVLKMLKPPNVERIPTEQNLTVKAIYELPFKVTMENKLTCFEYKVVHNILPTNSKLNKMKPRASPSCDRCNLTPVKIYFTFYTNVPVLKFFGKL